MNIGKEKRNFTEVMDEYGSIEALAGRVLAKLTIKGEMDSGIIETESDDRTVKAVRDRNVLNVIVERDKRSYSEVMERYGSVEELAARVLAKLTVMNEEEEV